MTVYELIQKLAQHKASAKVKITTPIFQTPQGDNIELEIQEIKNPFTGEIEIIVK